MEGGRALPLRGESASRFRASGGGLKTDVAIIGGGVIGLAVARELRRAGVGFVLLERRPAPGQGSTARANGGVRAQFTTRVNIEFSKFTIAELRKLDAYVPAGYLLMAGREEMLRPGYELQRSCGVPVEWWTPDRVPSFIRREGLAAATFCPTDGLVDPHGIVTAFWDEVRDLDLRFDTDVTALGPTIRTSRGDVRAEWIVNAAGPEARDVAALAGVDLPCVPVRRNLACTDPVGDYPAVIPMCVDLDTGVLIRRESGGFLIAYSNPDDPPGTDTSFDPRFLDDVAERVGNRFPFLETIGINPKRCWAGLYPETPDHHAIVGPTPGFPRFLQCVGFGGHGIMHSIAAARAIAELITRGRSETLDIRPLRFERFAEGDLVVESAVL